MEKLLGEGEDPNALNSQGVTPLFYAVASGAIDAVRLLVERGADVNSLSATGGMVLHSALIKQNGSLALYLIEQGADIHRPIGAAAMTPLHLAANYGLNKITKKLLDLGVDPNVQTEQGQTPILFAVAGISMGLIKPENKLIHTLLQCGADPRINPKAGMTLIEVARKHRHAQAALTEGLLALLEQTKDSTFKLDIKRMLEELSVSLPLETTATQAEEKVLDKKEYDEENKEGNKKAPLNSRFLGELETTEFNDWWGGKMLRFPFWDDREIAVTYIFEPDEDPGFIEEADKALANFLKLGREDRLAATPELNEYCQICWEATDYCGTVEGLSNEELEMRWLKDEDRNSLWNFVTPPDEIYVSRRDRRDKDIYVSMGMNCEWEEEHGLLMVYRQGLRLTRLSSQDGHLTEADAFDKADDEDALLSRF